MEEVASVLGPEEVAVLSQDDKAKVPLGKTAAKVQAPILMHLQYRVRLPDHDWNVGSRHQLIPSVYAGIAVKEDCLGQKESVTFSGPTYVAIRSGKDASSSASTHAQDFKRLLELPEFGALFKTADGKMKPVLLMSVDGGPDQNPRYKLVIQHAIARFLKHDLDGLFLFTNAPGRSAYNRAEHRMAALSKNLAGVVLLYNEYGSHLDNNGETIDEELERRNFGFTGQVLADVWSELKIDNYDVFAEYISPDETLPDPASVSPHWYANHVRESQYFLQVVKCDDRNCCAPFRSGLRKVLYQRFLPAPYPLRQGPLSIPSPADFKTEKFPSLLVRQTLALRPEYPQTKEIPYDLYCPSQRECIEERICPKCGIYFASKASMNVHRIKAHGEEGCASWVRPLRILDRRPGELLCLLSEDAEGEWLDVEAVDADNSTSAEKPPSTATIIKDLGKCLKDGCPFQEEF